MKTSTLIIAAVVLTLAGAGAQSADKVDKKTEENEARLAKMLEGRTAGEPRSCIPVLRPNQFVVIEGVAVVYDSGDTLYVARPTDPRMLTRNDVMVFDRRTSQLCNTDQVHTVDRDGGYFTGNVFLGKFLPYRKQD